jgi:transposase
MEDLIPQDHFLRKLDRMLDLDFVYELVRPLYGKHGRPSIDPVVLIKS